MDDVILKSLNQWYGRWPTLDDAAAVLISEPLTRFGVFASILVWLWFKPNDNQLATRRAVVIAVVAGLAAMVISRSLALFLPFRVRPFVRSDLGLHFYAGYDPGLRPWSAFPSDHAVLAVALAFAIWAASKRSGTFALIYGLIVICLPRVYMGLHYPTDILGGALVGAITVWVINKLRFSEAFATFVVNQEVRRPQVFYVASFVFLIELSLMFESFRSLARTMFHLLAKVA